MEWANDCELGDHGSILEALILQKLKTFKVKK
jgi:hypothetical protein